MKKIFIILAHLFPSGMKIVLLRMLGYKIGKKCYIGYSLILSKDVMIGDYVSIGHFNLIWNLISLKMLNGSRVGSFNWITGGGIGNLTIKLNSSIRRFHFLEASGSIVIGNNSILAGRSSHFFTHGLSPSNLDDVRPIIINDWCYIGSGVKIVPGVNIPDGCFVGMGSVVTKSFSEDYKLIAGNPAMVKKTLNKGDIYYRRSFMKHRHHPEEYIGE